MFKRTTPKSAKTTIASADVHCLEVTALTVLHVDDDPNDTELLRAAARKAGLTFSLHNAEDAEHAIAYLNSQGAYANGKIYGLPALVLLDLKMPRVTGFELLRWIRHHPELNHLPIIILSGSELQEDIQEAFACGANSYLVKPIGFEALIQLVKEIYSSWLMPMSETADFTARLPTHS